MKDIAPNNVLNIEGVVTTLGSEKDWATTFRHIFVGMIISMMLGYFLTLLFVLCYASYEFNIHGVVMEQIPQEIKNKYKSKTLIILETICWYLRQKKPILVSKEN